MAVQRVRVFTLFISFRPLSFALSLVKKSGFTGQREASGQAGRALIVTWERVLWVSVSLALEGRTDVEQANEEARAPFPSFPPSSLACDALLSSEDRRRGRRRMPLFKTFSLLVVVAFSGLFYLEKKVRARDVRNLWSLPLYRHRLCGERAQRVIS